MCFRLTPMDDVLECTDDAAESPDSSMVSNQDIDSLLGALLWPFAFVGAVKSGVKKSEDCFLS